MPPAPFREPRILLSLTGVGKKLILSELLSASSPRLNYVNSAYCRASSSTLALYLVYPIFDIVCIQHRVYRVFSRVLIVEPENGAVAVTWFGLNRMF